MKKITLLFACSFIYASSLWANSCQNYFLYNLAPDSSCKTKSNWNLYKEENSLTIMKNHNVGLRWHAPTNNLALNKVEAQNYCNSKGLRLPKIEEMKLLLAETFSERSDITSCHNVGRTLFTAEKTYDSGSQNIIPLDGTLNFPQRSFEIAAFDLSGNKFVTRYEKQVFNVMCVEDVDSSPARPQSRIHECSEIWFPGASVGTKCRLKDGKMMTKVKNGFEIDSDIFFNTPDRNVDVRSWQKAKEICQNKSSELLSYNTFNYLLENLKSDKTERTPQLFCVGVFAGAESAYVENTDYNEIYSWSFIDNDIKYKSRHFIDYRVICENKAAN